MSIDILKFIDEYTAGYEHIDIVAQALNGLRETLVHAMDRDYIGALYRTDYTVTGRGAFPIDMLRYTQSWPKDESSTFVIAESTEASASQELTVHLTKYHRDPVPQLASARWSSKFRWTVVESSVTTVES